MTPSQSIEEKLNIIANEISYLVIDGNEANNESIKIIENAVNEIGEKVKEMTA